MKVETDIEEFAEQIKLGKGLLDRFFIKIAIHQKSMITIPSSYCEFNF